nr:hypothetical protein [Vibrio mimicus]
MKYLVMLIMCGILWGHNTSSTVLHWNQSLRFGLPLYAQPSVR